MDTPIIIYTNASKEDRKKALRMMSFKKVEFRPLPALWFWMIKDDQEGERKV